MSPADQPGEGAPEGTGTRAQAKAKPPGRARPAGPRPTGEAARTGSAADTPTASTDASPAAGATLKERQSGRDLDAQGRLSGVAGVDRPDAFQRGRRVWPD